MSITKASLIDLNGQELILDADADTSITADTDDQIDIKIAGSDVITLTSSAITSSAGNTMFGGSGFDNGNLSGSAGGVNVFDATHPIVLLKETTGNTTFYMGKSTSSNFIATEDAQPISISTTDIQRVLVEAGGNVTINEPSNDCDFRVESDGNANMLIVDAGDDAVYIGKNSSTQNTAGTAISTSIGVRATVDQNVASILNRTTNDGSIISFRKDGTESGSIATEGGDMAIGNDDAGIQFVNGTEHFRPFSMASNAATDALMDIGSSSKRFKDLYLSSGVFLGGTGSANELDDYEEGTYSPSVQSTGSATFAYGTYTKVGRLVHVHTKITDITNTTSSGVFYISIPIAALATDVAGTCGILTKDINMTITGVYFENASYIALYSADNSGNFLPLRHNLFTTNSQIYLSFTYMAA
jgi:hypothetical protein